jgi:hypothetical protein
MSRLRSCLAASRTELPADLGTQASTSASTVPPAPPSAHRWEPQTCHNSTPTSPSYPEHGRDSELTVAAPCQDTTPSVSQHAKATFFPPLISCLCSCLRPAIVPWCSTTTERPLPESWPLPPSTLAGMDSSSTSPHPSLCPTVVPWLLLCRGAAPRLFSLAWMPCCVPTELHRHFRALPACPRHL